MSSRATRTGRLRPRPAGERRLRLLVAVMALGCSAALGGCRLESLFAARSATPLPSITPAGGNYATDQSVTISDASPGATIYYTTDGSAPTSSSAVYGGPIAVAGNGSTLTIEAIAITKGDLPSAVSVADYAINYAGGGISQAATPQFTPASGTYSTNQSIAITDATSGSTIYYTTNGSTPTTSSSVYSGPISVAGDGTTVAIRAMATASGLASSAVVTSGYAIFYPAAVPAFSEPGGMYGANQSVALSDSTSGVTIYYTTNGTAPTTSSAVYSGPISVAGSGTSETIEAMAAASNRPSSTVASATYNVLYAPTGLSIGSGLTGSFPISWSTVAGATSYSLLRATSSSFSGATTVYSGSAATFTDTPPAAGTTYYYEVTASDTAGASPASASASGTTLQSNGLPVITTTYPSGLPAPNSLLGTGDSWVSNPGGYSPLAQALVVGGYTYLFYSWDTNNLMDTGVAVYNTAGSIIFQQLFTGSRYCTTLSESGTNVVVSGCQAPTTSFSIAWSSIQQ